jgi:hypothetical protein
MPYVPTFHPGEILREEYLKPLGLSPYAVAKALGVPRTRIERIVAGKDAHNCRYGCSPREVFQYNAAFLVEHADQP